MGDDADDADRDEDYEEYEDEEDDYGVYGARILAEVPTASAEDDGVVGNHSIAMQTELGDQEIEWTAFDFSTEPPSQKTFKVEFDDSSVSNEFRDMFAEGKDLAEQSEILETIDEQDPSQFYYGQGGDEE